ncbi:hypothetical protein Bphy_1650 [Paraburkholderia phymatum STM815]|uniref:Uncharacterized protein n=1 Tax=Paraburkholderia phymatum (strain DSM 17167 / CIP 108236 / LMG 21445 / STM815) TaxID=391038 RepID=B2JKA9_PARP8|nr:hypothetical protein Bphy_1650 [Paraburkholderia phymatum STM815]
MSCRARLRARAEALALCAGVSGARRAHAAHRNGTIEEDRVSGDSETARAAGTRHALLTTQPGTRALASVEASKRTSRRVLSSGS